MGFLDPILSALFSDPSGSVGGKALMGILGMNGGTGTSTPLAPVPSQLGSPFAFRQGLLGDSMFANGIRGGLAGLAGSNGYTGLSAVGAGAQSAIQSGRQRQEFNMQNMLAGQQYQQGQLGIMQNEIGLNRLLAQYKDAGLLPQNATIADLTGAVSAGGAPGGAPQQQTAGGPINPVAQGGQPESTWQPQSQPAGEQAVQGGTNGGPYDPGSPEALQQFKNDTVVWGADVAKGIQAGRMGGLDYQTALELAKSRGQITNGRAGSEQRINGQLVSEVPVQKEVQDPHGSPGQLVLANVYPSGRIEYIGQGGGGSVASGTTGNQAPFTGGASGLPDSLWTAQQYVESHFDPKVISPMGAKGPAQFTDATAKQYGGNGTDAQKAYMADLYKKYGSLPLALTAYNWGPGNTDMWLKSGGDPQKLPKETQSYLAKVLDLTGQAGAQTGGQGGGQSGGVVSTPAPFSVKRAGQYADTQNAMENGIQPSYQAEQRIMALAQALKSTTSGAWATEKAHVLASLKAVGLNPADFSSDSPAEVQIALKNNFQAAIAQIQQFSSQPAAISLNQAQENFAHPDLQPEANLAILAQAAGTVRFNRDMAVALGKANLNGSQDPNVWMAQWAEKHPMQSYIDKAAKDIGPLKGMSGAGTDATPGSNGKITKTWVFGPDGKLVPQQ